MTGNSNKLFLDVCHFDSTGIYLSASFFTPNKMVLSVYILISTRQRFCITLGFKLLKDIYDIL